MRHFQLWNIFTAVWGCWQREIKHSIHFSNKFIHFPETSNFFWSILSVCASGAGSTRVSDYFWNSWLFLEHLEIEHLYARSNFQSVLSKISVDCLKKCHSPCVTHFLHFVQLLPDNPPPSRVCRWLELMKSNFLNPTGTDKRMEERKRSIQCANTATCSEKL